MKGWKKLLIGCGCLGFICIAVLVGVGIWLVSYGKRSFETIAAVTEPYKLTNAANAFVEPESHALTPEMLAKWLAVRRETGPVFDELMAQYAKSPSYFPVAVAEKYIKPGVAAHVAALEKQKMSFDEYRWVSLAVASALMSEMGGEVEGLADVRKTYVDLKEESMQGPSQRRDFDAMLVKMSDEETSATLGLLAAEGDTLRETEGMVTAEAFLIVFAPALQDMHRGGTISSPMEVVPAEEDAPATATATAAP